MIRTLAVAMTLMWSVVHAVAPIDGSGKPTQPLLKILELQGIKHDGSLRGVTFETQQQWVLPPNSATLLSHREAIRDQPEYYKQFQQLGVFEARMPQRERYRYAVVMGDRLPVAYQRLTFLIKLWEQGTRFEKIVFLTGARQVDPDSENVAAFFGGKLKRCQGEACFAQPSTETAMMLLVYGQLDVPQGMRQLPIQLVDTPLQLSSGRGQGPNAAEMLVEWLVRGPEPGSCLLVSNQPYVGYQEAMASAIMPREFYVETVGEAGGEEDSLEAHLDILGRWIYAESLRIRG